MSVEVAWFLGLLLISLILVWHASAIERLEKQVRHLNALADTRNARKGTR